MIYPVSHQKIEALQRRIAHLGLKESDFKESFIRSGGHGGQNVNKVSTCVVLKHLPTGLEVRCQMERSQAMNRFLAKRLLVEKIERRLLGEASAYEKAIQKIRRQKRKRSKRAKDKMLASKKIRAEKKGLRRRPTDF